MKNSLKILFITLLILGSNNTNAKISGDLWQGAKELKKVPKQMLAIPTSLSKMYQQLVTTKNEIQKNIQEVNNAKTEINDIKKMLTNNKQINSLPEEKKQNLQNALDALTEDDGSGALDNLKEVLTEIKKRMNVIITNSPSTLASISTLTAIAAAKINKKRLGKTLPQRMEAVSNIIDNFGL